MNYFSIPADFNRETIDNICILNSKNKYNKVSEVYGQATEGLSFLFSGRTKRSIPSISLSDLANYILCLDNKGIKFNYTLNPSCSGNYEFSKEGIQNILSILRDLNNIGVHSLTLASPSLIEIVNYSEYKFEIKTSAICEVTSPRKALFYKNMGASRVVIDPDITRDFDKISNICSEFGDGIEIIINNNCLRNCSYKMFHYNHDAHCLKSNDSQDILDYYNNRCSLQKAKDISSYMRMNWIRPEDIAYYKNCGISNYKIQGRQNVLKGNLLKTLEAYFSGSFDGNLCDLIMLFAPYNSFYPYIDNKALNGFIEKFYENKDFCKEKCSKCNYCYSAALKCMNIEKTEQLYNKALIFYKNLDLFYTSLENECNLK